MPFHLLASEAPDFVNVPVELLPDLLIEVGGGDPAFATVLGDGDDSTNCKPAGTSRR